MCRLSAQLPVDLWHALVTTCHTEVKPVDDEPRNVQTTAEVTPTRRCDNPDCASRLAWPAGRGRPPRYCSDACRQRAADSAARIRDRLEAAEAELANDDLTYRQRRAITTTVTRLHWLLSAYPASVQRPST